MFTVLALGEFIDDDGIEIAICAFAELFHSVTSKHQKQMKLLMITKGLKEEKIKQITKRTQTENKVELINWHEQEQIEECYKNASVLILPSQDNLSKLVSESFSFGLPVICYENEFVLDIVDPSCGMLINEENTGENVQEFCEMLRILYFDPEAQKILKRGALKKYEEALSWGHSNKSSSRNLAAY